MEVSCTLLLVCMEEKGENYERSIYVVNLRNICMYTWYADRFVVFRKENGCLNTTHIMHLGSKRSRWFCVISSFFEPRGLGSCFFCCWLFSWFGIGGVLSGRNPRRVDYQTVHKQPTVPGLHCGAIHHLQTVGCSKSCVVWKIDFRMIYTLGSWID